MITGQNTGDTVAWITLTCIDCGAGGTLSWTKYESPGIHLDPGIAYRCQACTGEKKAKLDRLIEAGVFEKIDQLVTGIREVRDLVQEP